MEQKVELASYFTPLHIGMVVIGCFVISLLGVENPIVSILYHTNGYTVDGTIENVYWDSDATSYNFKLGSKKYSNFDSVIPKGIDWDSVFQEYEC